MRAHDRRAIAEDLFEVAGGRDVRAEHVEELARRYRERFAGAQRILLTQQIADEILAYQAAPRPAAPRASDARREDDEVIGIALDPISTHGVDVATAAPARAAHPLELPALDLPPPPPAAVPPAPTSSPDRPRTGAAVGWAAPQRGTTGSRPVTGADRATGDAAAAPDQGLWAPLRDGPSDLPAPPIDDPSGHPAAAVPDLGTPAAASVTHRIELEGPDAPPPARRPSSRPPPAPAALGRLDVAGISSRPPPPRPAPAAAPPVASAAPPARSASPLERRKLASILGGAAAALLLLGLLVVRPSCIFPAPTAEVQGRFASDHLGIAVSFPEAWLHEGSRDESEGRGDWERASSVFFQGVDVDEFAIQLTLVTLSHESRPPSEDDLRSVGAAELAGAVKSRKCAPYDRYGSKAVRCTGLETRGDRRFAMLEEYFVAGPRIVYARGLVETVGADPAAEQAAPVPTAGARPGAESFGSPLADVDARRLEAVLDSIEPL